MVEHSAVNRVVVGSSPTRGVFLFKSRCKKATHQRRRSLLSRLFIIIQIFGSVVKRLRHRPFTAVTRVRFPSESL